MSADLFIAIVSVGISALMSLALIPLIERWHDRNAQTTLGRFLERHGLFERSGPSTHRERLAHALTNFRESSDTLDQVIRELALYSQQREAFVVQLESSVSQLQAREGELKTRVTDLEKLPPEALRHFEALLNTGDRRSARRDYALFGAGVLVSVAVGVALKFAGL